MSNNNYPLAAANYSAIAVRLSIQVNWVLAFTVSTIATESVGSNLHLQKGVYNVSENSVTISVKGSVPGKTVDLQAVINPYTVEEQVFVIQLIR